MVTWAYPILGNAHIISGWSFQTCFIFHNIWNNPSHWLICFRGVETTNQIYIIIYIYIYIHAYMYTCICMGMGQVVQVPGDHRFCGFIFSVTQQPVIFIDVLFPLVGWLIEGFVYPFNNREMMIDGIPNRPLYFIFTKRTWLAIFTLSNFDP